MELKIESSAMHHLRNSLIVRSWYCLFLAVGCTFGAGLQGAWGLLALCVVCGVVAVVWSERDWRGRYAYGEALVAWAAGSHAAESTAEVFDRLTGISPPRRYRESYRNLYDAMSVVNDLVSTGRGRESPAVALASSEVKVAYRLAVQDLGARIDDSAASRQGATLEPA